MAVAEISRTPAAHRAQVLAGEASPAVRRPRGTALIPWLGGLLALLALAAAALIYGGRVDSSAVVPQAVHEAQRAATRALAQQIRRGVNGGLDDLEQLAAALSRASTSAGRDDLVEDFARRYRRYRAVYLLDERGQVASAVGTPHAAALAAAQSGPAAGPAMLADNLVVAPQLVPVELGPGTAGAVVGEYDLQAVQEVLDDVRPGSAWVVDGQGRVLASTEGFVALQHHDFGGAVAAAQIGTREPVSAMGVGVLGRPVVLAGAPVAGKGAAGGLDWTVLTSRSVDSIRLPQVQARGHALVFGLLLMVTTVAVFGWAYLRWVRPMREIADAAARLAEGDLRGQIAVRGGDELGRTASSLERLRTRLVRDATVRVSAVDEMTRTLYTIHESTPHQKDD